MVYFNREDAVSAAIVDNLLNITGALLMGRRAYDLGDQMDGYVDNPYKVPHFVLTHTPPTKLPKGDTEFIYVTSGIESAVRQARAAAGDKTVVVSGGADIAQQCLRLGLLYQLDLHIVPVLMPGGLRLFDNLGDTPIRLEKLSVSESPALTHISYRVVK